MDEELLDITTETTVEVAGAEITQVEVDIEDEEYDGSVEEEIVTVEVAPAEIIDIEVDEAMGWVGGDSERHYSLAGRNDPNQHEIKAITGLRAELDALEKLQTVYSDKPSVANYYKWKDVSYDEYGYFVSIVPEESKIQICNGSDIFGVSVDSAGFIGNQAADVPRDNTYGLIVTSGLVGVRCELDVDVGDSVVSNARGCAKKSDSNYGYKVLAKTNKDGVKYAVILLGVQADKTNLLGLELQDVKEKVGVNEQNIVSAINVANQAYNKANESVTVSEEALKNALESLIQSGEANTNAGNALNSAVSASQVAVQAQAIANSAATTAVGMKKEAVEKANEALDETSQLRDTLKNTANKLNTDLNNAVLEMKELKEDLEPLALWPEGSDTTSATGYAGFVARADEDSSILGAMVGRKGENGETLAGFIQEAEETRATVRGIVSYEYDDKTGAAGLIAQVDDTQSEVSAIANYNFKKGDGTTVQGLAGLNAYVNENESNVALVANRIAGKYTVIPEVVEKDKRDKSKIYAIYDSDTEEIVYYYYSDVWKKSLRFNIIPNVETSMIYYVSASKLYLYYADRTWKSTDDAYIAGLPTSIAGIQVVTDDNSASINSLTSWQGETNTAMARIEQKADANGAYIQSTVANIDKYAVGPYSQAYGFTLEQAASVLEEGTLYVPTENKTGDDAETYNYTDENGETKKYTRSFTRGYLYKWGKLTDYPYGWITVDKNYAETTETNTSSQAVYFTTKEPEVGGNFGYWYTNGDAVTSPYEPYTLYKWESYVDENNTTQHHWVAVATLAGNSQSRAVSQIRQDTNSIELRVTNTEGSATYSKQWIDNNSANIQDVVSWKSKNGESLVTFMQTADDNYASASQVVKIVDEDGNINAASIVAAVNDAGSSVVIDADHINFEAKNYTVKSDYITFTDSTDYSAISKNITFNAEQIKFTAGDLGGRNLLRYSDFSNYEGEYSDVCTFDGEVIIFQNDTLGQSSFGDTEVTVRFSDYAIKNMRGKTMTLSMDYLVETKMTYGTTDPWVGFKLLITQNDDTEISGNWVDGYDGINLPVTKTSQWKRFSQTVKIPGDKDIKRGLFLICFNDAKGKIKFRHPQVEFGVLPTDWTLAPEDYSTTAQVNAKFELAVLTDENGNLASSVYIGADKLTIDTDDFKLDGKGRVTATGGQIASWEIDSTKIYYKDGNVGLYAGSEFNAPSLVSPNTSSSVRVYAGEKIETFTIIQSTMFNTGSAAGVIDMDIPITQTGGAIKSVKFKSLSTTSSDMTKSVSIKSSSKINVRINAPSLSGKTIDIEVEYTYQYNNDIGRSQTMILEDGSLYASAAKFGTGTIGSDNSIFLSTTNMGGVNGFFDGTSITDWRMTVGSNFGVTSGGYLYAKDANITGTVTSGLVNVDNMMISDNYITCIKNEELEGRLEIKDISSVNINTTSLKVSDGICGTISNSAKLIFNETSGTMITYRFNAIPSWQSNGSKEVQVTLINAKTGESVEAPQELKVWYNQSYASPSGGDYTTYTGYGTISKKSKQCTITLPKETTRNNITYTIHTTTNYGTGFSSEHWRYDWNDISADAVGAIKSTGNIIPDSNVLSIGSLDCHWGHIYTDNLTFCYSHNNQTYTIDNELLYRMYDIAYYYYYAITQHTWE